MSSWCHNTLSDARKKRDGKERFIDILTLKCSPQRLRKLTRTSFGCLGFGDRHRLPAECDLKINIKSFCSIIHDDKCAPKGGEICRIVYGGRQQVVGTRRTAMNDNKALSSIWTMAGHPFEIKIYFLVISTRLHSERRRKKQALSVVRGKIVYSHRVPRRKLFNSLRRCQNGISFIWISIKLSRASTIDSHLRTRQANRFCQ